MVCRSARLSNPADDFGDRSTRFPSISNSKSGTEGENGGSGNANTMPKSATTTRSQVMSGHRTAASGAKSAMSMRSSNARQLAILDKTTVLDKMDYNAAEDIRWISGIESTGTLQVGPVTSSHLTGRGYKVYRNGSVHPKLRIRRGLVSHSLAGNAKNSPKLGVSGGRINEDPPSSRKPNNTTNNSRRTSDDDHKRTVSQSFPNEKYSYVDSMTALEQIMKRNNGHGRSKLVHILPSAYNSENNSPIIRAKGK